MKRLFDIIEKVALIATAGPNSLTPEERKSLGQDILKRLNVLETRPIYLRHKDNNVILYASESEIAFEDEIYEKLVKDANL